MSRWKFVATAILACALGAGSALLVRGNEAAATADPILAAKQLADGKAAPDLDVVQATYDFEISSGNPAHDKGLKLVQAKCMNGQESAYICFVSFYSERDPDQRIYNSAAEIARIGGGWFLKGGLCKNSGDQGGAHSAY
jgi:hypothetical protein